MITLFGERLTKQFLSESISLLDNIIFALSPLGVLTAVVSVIRVCGGSSLRAFIGRAQEGPAEAESELLPCVSESTAELFNEGGISRVFGRPKIVEIVMWEEENLQDGKKVIEIGTLRDALKKRAWSAQGSGLSDEDLFDPARLPELDIPNLSLNKGIKRRDQFWFHGAAIIGALLQLGQLVLRQARCFGISLIYFQVSWSMLPSPCSPFLDPSRKMEKPFQAMRSPFISLGLLSYLWECSAVQSLLSALPRSITSSLTNLARYSGCNPESKTLEIKSSMHLWLSKRDNSQP